LPFSNSHPLSSTTFTEYLSSTLTTPHTYIKMERLNRMLAAAQNMGGGGASGGVSCVYDMVKLDI
jgi:hypothetical protein